MFTITDESLQPRELRLDLDLYVGGDRKLKRDLTLMIIMNVRQLRQSLHDAIRHEVPSLFSRICHKVKFSLTILEDQELIRLSEKLQQDLENPPGGVCFETRTKLFNCICLSTIKSLEIELRKS